jgi:hypothetical protein
MAKRLLAALLVALLPVAAHAADSRWLHVTVDGKDETVRVHLPMTVVSAALPLLKEHGMDASCLKIDSHQLDRAELAKVVTALKGAEDGQYITVEDKDDHVKVTKKGQFLFIHVEEKHGAKGAAEGGDHVEVKMPLDVVAALLGGDGDELDVVAALDQLEKYDGTDLVTVNDDGETVRIWIDRKPAS